ncbi:MULTISPECIES: FMN-dependent NADH-azoreductase [Pseudomonas]|uniref:FMN dependent NADH:quinone oxidoreductase n=1 Tax=Pseudomonas asplenii TaxID=53407 RepID=A0A0M9GEA0_9PSED|nr:MULTISPECIES: FMN-dependent NADH-azoreductase [Pseudomonas]KPA88978.1 acyl carrier protein phosphodiesterase [Pseudomonas fuscovaginae]KPA99219.1 acyl carrier protein phosphodiesterase [Pseudomonas fuscovaginae]
MNILHIDSSILGEGSVTRELSAELVAQLRARHPTARVTYRDLAEHEVRHLNGAIAAGFRQPGGGEWDEATVREHQVSETLVTEFLHSDLLVIGAPMYNFSLSSQLKAWLDRIAQVGRTFKYTENGPVGLSAGRRVIVVSARGGFYAQGPFAHMDFQENYLKAFFGFLGIGDVQFVRAEGASKGDQVRQQGITRARLAIADVLSGLPVSA